jgi:F-type H+-transporting ATPase subunit alpha
MFASDLDAASKRQLERGQRLTELLKQPQYSPYPIEEQVVSVWVGTTGRLDDVPVDDVRRFEAELLDFLRRERGGILDGIRETGQFPEDAVKSLEEAVTDFKQTFETSDGRLLEAGREEHEALEEENVLQEQIQKQRRG